MSDEQEIEMNYDAPIVRNSETGHFLTPMNPLYPAASHKTQRRNPTTQEGTSSDAVKVRDAIDIEEWTEGTWKFLSVVALSMKAEEQDILGIEKELTANPNLIAIDAATMHPMAIEDILAIVEHHRAPYIHMTTNKGSNKTRSHGYRRLKQVAQKFPKISPKVVIVTVIQTVKNMLKTERKNGDISEEVEERLYGNVLNSIFDKVLSLNTEIRGMEKTAGTKFLKEYVESQPEGREVFKILEEQRIVDETIGWRQGDTKVAFDISSPRYTEVEE